jgi:hypothetical protein
MDTFQIVWRNEKKIDKDILCGLLPWEYYPLSERFALILNLKGKLANSGTRDFFYGKNSDRQKFVHIRNP